MVAVKRRRVFWGAFLTSDVCVTGTCINNTSVMMFKKGSFEIGGTIYPVTIKVRAVGEMPRRRVSAGR